MTKELSDVAIRGGRLVTTPVGVVYEGDDGTQCLFAGVRLSVGRWCVKHGAAFQWGGTVYVSRWWVNDERVPFDVHHFAHEYGHYLQQREMGWWRYLRKVAYPSVKDLLFGPAQQHYKLPCEHDATQRGKAYYEANKTT